MIKKYTSFSLHKVRNLILVILNQPIKLTILIKVIKVTCNIYASYNGSQQGFTIRDSELVQHSYTNTGINYSSIAAGSNGDLYCTSNNHIYHYSTDGSLINDMAFPDDSITYTCITVKGNKVYATYEGSQLGVTVRDLDLNQLTFFDTNINASGIAVAKENSLYITSKNHVYNYDMNGTLIKDMTFPDEEINYTDVTVLCDVVCVSYDGAQQGFSVRDLDLNQKSFCNVDFKISAIAVGSSNNVYLTSENHIYNYNLDGTLVKDMVFSVPSINYTGISAIFNNLT